MPRSNLQKSHQYLRWGSISLLAAIASFIGAIGAYILTTGVLPLLFTGVFMLSSIATVVLLHYTRATVPETPNEMLNVVRSSDEDLGDVLPIDPDHEKVPDPENLPTEQGDAGYPSKQIESSDNRDS